MNRDGESGPPVPMRDALEEVSRRVGRVHYALAEASRVDVDLQRWCLEELMVALDVAEQARGGEEGDRRHGSRAGSTTGPAAR